jgi:thioredoxin reductase
LDSLITLLFTIAGGITLASVFVGFVRFVLGPDMLNRMVAFGAMTIMSLSGIALISGERPRPKLIEGSEEMIECDTLIPAIGQEADYTFLPESVRSKIEVARGMVVAIANGHSAAKGIDIYLSHFGNKNDGASSE